MHVQNLFIKCRKVKSFLQGCFFSTGVFNKKNKLLDRFSTSFRQAVPCFSIIEQAKLLGVSCSSFPLSWECVYLSWVCGITVSA